MGRRPIMLGVLAGAMTLTACGRTPLGLETDDAGSDTDDLCEEPGDCSSVVTLERAADILFVIDNSGSMGQEQGTLAANFASFIDIIEDDQIGASYRIGVTTTDGGGLRSTSCRDRLSDFLWEGDLGTGMTHFEDQRQAGCLDHCQHAGINLQPTPTDDDPTPLPRPWLEKTGGQSNLPPGVSMTEAFQCIGPQGMQGLGFEAPLESMREVLISGGSGFFRDDALLAIIFVTDEADCSMPAANRDDILFQMDHTRPLWTLPERPSSAVCWNAGVTCEGGPGVYETCYAEDKDWNGQPTTGEPVLYPVQRYVDTLREIANQKEAANGNGTVLVAIIAGVPPGYADGAELVYQDSDFHEFNLEYGIGPGCNRGQEGIFNPPGIPPVRLREFAEAFATDERNLFSVCSTDYSAALQQIAQAIGELSARACVPGCVADQNPNVGGLQPGCSVVEQRADEAGGDRAVPRCQVTNEGWSFPAGTDICYRPLTDFDGRTLTPADDMSPQCLTRGANLEFVIERVEGVSVPAGTSVRVDCQLDRLPSSGDCELQ